MNTRARRGVELKIQLHLFNVSAKQKTSLVQSCLCRVFHHTLWLRDICIFAAVTLHSEWSQLPPTMGAIDASVAEAVAQHPITA